MASDLPCKPWISSTTRLSLLVREYQHADMQFLIRQTALELSSTNFSLPSQHMRRSMRRRHKLSLQTNNSIEETTTTTKTAAATPRTTAIDRNHVALYATRKDVAHGNIPRRSKKSQEPSSGISSRTASRSE
jgi:hypothetical protein